MAEEEEGLGGEKLLSISRLLAAALCHDPFTALVEMVLMGGLGYVEIMVDRQNCLASRRG